ncbi:hypothetical protein KHA80_06605 [Anaerobacillus sp. HL2]|nr:hypothetical protein KHA80_06605 [Anaerobacillus sp. HL2]
MVGSTKEYVKSINDAYILETSIGYKRDDEQSCLQRKRLKLKDRQAQIVKSIVDDRN